MDQIMLIMICLSADGNYEVTIMTKAILHYTGRVRWNPPAIYKSYCGIDVEYFPFDIQECFLKISSWTYHGFELDLQHFCNGTKEGDDTVIPRGIRGYLTVTGKC